MLYVPWAHLHEWERQDERADAYTNIGPTLGAIIVRNACLSYGPPRNVLNKVESVTIE